MSSTDPDQNQRGLNLAFKLALGCSALLLALRLSLLESVGYGDAEALYASYSLFRQASYLEHPGLIGWLGSLIADNNGVPSPASAHRFTSSIAMAVPWAGGLAARAAGASWRGAMWTILALLITPEFAIGLFGFTPDAPLALLWVSALGLTCVALRSESNSLRASASWAGAGLCAGLACMAKASGALLVLSILVASLLKPSRRKWKTAGPWIASICCAIVTMPLIVRELRLGLPMLQHRLVATQVGFGPTLRNLGALVGGQLLYVTPFVLLAAVFLAVDLTRRHNEDATSRLLFMATFIPLVALSALCLLSRVAEPHWIAPSYVALAIHLGKAVDVDKPCVSKRLAIASLLTSATAIGAVFCLVRFPLLPKIMGARYQARYDLVNDLYVWKDGNKLVREAIEEAGPEGLSDLAVVAPHWVICGQLQAGLGNRVRVGCETQAGDDFQLFYPTSEWRRAPAIVYVTDDRYDIDARTHFPDRAVQSVSRVGIRRGGVLVRTIRVTRLGRMGAG